MRRRPEINSKSWPSWRYGPNGEAAIFQTEAEVPHGWTRKPGEIYEAPQPIGHDRDQLIADLEAKGVEVLGHWSNSYMKELLVSSQGDQSSESDV